jgi:integrase
MKRTTINTENMANRLQFKTGKMEVSALMAIREARHRRRTRGVNHALVQQLGAFWGETLYIHDITEDFCFKFSEFLLERVSRNSTRTYLHKLHALLEYAVSCHVIGQHSMPPIRELIPKFTSPQRIHLSMEELDILSNTPCRHSETKRAFLFACQTGLRLSDIETLRWEHIVENEDVPTIVKTQVKTGKEVRVPLNVIALQLLGTSNREGLVFKLMSRSVIASDLRQWAADAGITKHITFHVSRHTFATLSIASGVNIYVVSKLCGHSTVKTTEIYAHMIDKTLQQGVELLSRTMIDHSSKKRKSESQLYFGA